MISNLLSGVLTLPTWLQIILYIVFIIGGMLGLIKGADAFVSGASGIAKKLKVPAIIIGLTIVSIGTSLPEASVSISGAIQGSADISIGNIVGSNMFNLLIVLGFSLVFVPIALNKKLVLKDIMLMLLSSILLLIFTLFGNGENGYILSRIECGILFTIFVAYIVYSIIEARQANKVATATAKPQPTLNKQNSPTPNAQNEAQLNVQNKTTLTAKNAVKNCKIAKDNASENATVEKLNQQTSTGENKMSKNIICLILGLLGIVIGGDFVVFGAQNFAIKVGMSEILVGLTIVAIGTSLPELVTSIVAARKGENDIALGNVIGSNIFNVLFILGLTGLITPLAVSANALIDIVIMLCVFVAFIAFALLKNKLPKYLGYIMITSYAIYLTYIILRDFVLIA